MSLNIFSFSPYGHPTNGVTKLLQPVYGLLPPAMADLLAAGSLSRGYSGCQAIAFSRQQKRRDGLPNLQLLFLESL